MNKENFSFQQPEQYSKVLQQKLGAVLHTLKENSTVSTPVKIAFQAVREMLELQSEALEHLQEQMTKKASKAQMHQLLAQKVSAGDLSGSLGDIRDILDKKIGAAEFNTSLEESQAINRLNRQLEDLEGKCSSETELLSCVVREIGQNADRLQRKGEDMSRDIRQLKSSTGKTGDRLEKLAEKQKAQAERLMGHLQEELKRVQRTVSDSRLWVTKQIEESAARIETMTTSASTQQLKHVVGKQQFLQLVQSVKQACEQNEREIKKVAGSLGRGMKKKQYEAIQQTVLRAVENLRSQFAEYVSERVSRAQAPPSKPQDQAEPQFIPKEHFTRELMQLELALSGKTSLQEVKSAFKAFEQDMLYSLDTLRSEMNRRIDNELISQAKQPVDLYERSPLLSKSVQQSYLGVEQFRRYERDQNIIYESLCRENIVGRWTFKGSAGEAGSQMVGWQGELINTLPDNFIWVPHSHYIKVKSGGLYRLLMGVFTACQQPQADLLVNERKVAGVQLKPLQGSEEVARFLEAYVYLKENSRISSYYSGSRHSQGFLYIKRL